MPMLRSLLSDSPIFPRSYLSFEWKAQPVCELREYFNWEKKENEWKKVKLGSLDWDVEPNIDDEVFSSNL